MVPLRRRLLAQASGEERLLVRLADIASLSSASAESPCGGGGGGGEEEAPYADVPRRGRRWERKPYPTPVKELVRQAKAERRARLANPCRVIEHPPDNGLLVADLSPFCEEVHVGRSGGHEIRSCEGRGSAARGGGHAWTRGGIRDVARFPHCFHLVDRVGRPRVGHKERLLVPRLPAVVELCIQAGLDLDDFPARRRTRPVCSIEGRIVDFDPQPEVLASARRPRGGGAEEAGERTLESWLEICGGAERLMERYAVQTCGYCAEVQFRAGLHAWQEATVDDLIGPSYVWHMRDPAGPPPANELKRFYGKAPAAVELCVQAGAPPPRQYWSMMRLDVALPAPDERDLVA
ncbi:unnamed protein product [Spirodela intermedia]|uniref:APO domain-containing protein n=1 Tax=Spirodela intermedia TaxID=51605 RepID=A0A7I8J178_SPIIN|nr:unnamed protein product [Spirodela intermedia]CAA6663984.1 unnamed protein product [Spirodela intermedia]